ncbi:hypothetical protein HYPSUDRAFT_648520 [Hypholoma sublateritium FD-334 SS-4]|uniref:Uncharacterized protein n=1 Tax=Hypholoma sublateritium (strain FD-334 SS-4) TaxID=945553 RepID=A0A0D2L6W1_HYPSF|nr:hypothetical protein HYPSUDRAFT_648520 [Hypholoma sublateritium FD-334 SS-4]
MLNSIIPGAPVRHAIKNRYLYLQCGPQHPEHTFVYAPATQPSAALRILATARMLEALTPGQYFNIPDMGLELEMTLVHASSYSTSASGNCRHPMRRTLGRTIASLTLS